MVQLRNGKATEVESLECHLVTGGGGYAGFRLGKALHELGHRVILFDIKEPLDIIPEGIRFIKGDIRNKAELEVAFEGVSVVYHLASYGMSGREQLNTQLIEDVNVKGTKNVLDACRYHGIERLVFTSTFNVVFGGQTIEGGDESLPYLPLDKHPDHYSRTKSIAEQIVLEASSNTLTADEDENTKLYTCALRLAGVYGPGEQRHLPRVVNYIEKGLFLFTYGASDSLVEFLHVDNLVQAHIKAAQALSEHSERQAAGQAYFISDGKPINNFLFFKPLVEGLGYTYPRMNLPLGLVYFIAFITEMIHWIVGPIYNFQPLLTRTEVYKTGVTHYFDLSKAQTQLGYEPTIQNAMGPVVEWFKRHGHGKHTASPGQSSTIKRLLLDLILAGIFAAFILSFLPRAR